MCRCILATVHDVITDHVAWLMPDIQPPQKRSRFARPATSRELEQSSKGFLLKSIPKNDPWAMWAFQDWLKTETLN